MKTHNSRSSLRRYEDMKSIIIDAEVQKNRRIQLRRDYPEIYNKLTKLIDYGYRELFEDNIIEVLSCLIFAKEFGHDKNVIENVGKCVDFLIKCDELKKDKERKLMIDIDIETAKVGIIDRDQDFLPVKFIYKT